MGRRLTALLVKEGHDVCWLSRSEDKSSRIKRYRWSVEEGYVDPRAFSGVEHLVHLAGASIISKRWTRSYRKKMISSRVYGAMLLQRETARNNVHLKSYIGASAVGYYGTASGMGTFTESDGPGTDFLAELCVAWEKAHAVFAGDGVRTVVVRTAIVLSPDGGALKKMLPVFRAGLGAPVGNGAQAFPWIHIDDLAAIYAQAVFSPAMRGAYNAVAPERISNGKFSSRLAAVLHRPFWLPGVPVWLLKIVFGEAAGSMASGLFVSAEKILRAGYGFRFRDSAAALRHLFRAGSSAPA